MNVQIMSLIPACADDKINWSAIENQFASCGFSDLSQTPQNPLYHGEGDVLTHTKLVCDALNRMDAFHALPPRQKAELFLAAVLHDIGKARTTRLEDDVWVSPHHALTGSMLVRAFLWRDGGFCGTVEKMRFRETVCALIRYHMLPMHLSEQEDAVRTAREVASITELAPDFSWELLCLLAEADVRGRIARDVDECLEKVELCRLLTDEAGCLRSSYSFPDAFTKRAYLSGRRVSPEHSLFDETWGEVIMLSGLPGTGKDTWIRENAPELPMISLDEIRKEFAVGPTDPQGSVVQAAHERAKEYLRKKQPFVWNATSLTKETRQTQVSLFERYGARVRIVYLETDWNTRTARNRGRLGEVPESAVERMLEKTVPPTPEEAQIVDWVFL